MSPEPGTIPEHPAHPTLFGNARFTAVTPHCLRLEYSPTRCFIDEPSLFAVDRSVRESSVRAEANGNSLRLETNALTLHFRNDGNPFHAGNLRVEIANRTVWTPGLQQQGNLGGTVATLDQVKGPIDLGEGVLSRDGWFLLDDSGRHLLRDGWVCSRPSNAGIDWFFFGYGTDYRAALRALTAAGGPVPLPRKYALGSWYSRWWKYSDEDYRRIVAEYHEHDFPLDVMVMDMEWHLPGWTGWTWNRALIPDPGELLGWFREQGLAVTLNIHPHEGVAPHEECHGEFARALAAEPTETIPFDAADERYMRALFEHAHAPHEALGVDFWWLDWQQDEFTLGIPDLPHLAWLNKLYFDRSRERGERGLQFSRWGGWGDHRHPIHFSGDTDTGWTLLGFIVPFTATAGNVGCFFWSHDVGGHFGERNEEVYARWVQFALTNPAMRIHSGIIDYLDRRPWLWPEKLTASMREAFHWRSRLFPYVYSSAAQSCAESVPLLRPMYLDRGPDEHAHAHPQQYFFGDAMLHAPIAMSGGGEEFVAAQLVWFPEGEWYNIFTNEKFEGGQERLVCASIDETPLHARGGTPLPMQPYRERMATAPLGELVVRCWPGPDGAFVLYEDDGRTSDHERGRFARTPLTHRERDGLTELRIGPTIGEYEGQPGKRRVVIELCAVEAPRSVRVNGVDAFYEYDEEERLLRVRGPETSIREEVRCEVETLASDPDFFRERARQRRLRGIMGADYTGTVADALEEASLSEDDRLRALLALAGLGLIERPSHHPEPTIHRAVVRNGDSLLPAEGAELSFRQLLLPEVRVLDERRMLLPELEGTTPYELPSFPPHQPGLFEQVREVMTLSVPFRGRSLEVREQLHERTGHIRSWHYLGPFSYDPKQPMTAQRFAPEEDLLHPTLPELPRDMAWKPIDAGADGVVELHDPMPLEFTIAYATTEIAAESPGEAILGFRTDDGVEAWLNGEKIHEKDVHRGIDHPWEWVDVSLRSGRNVLLLKISQNVGRWEFSVIGRR